MMKRPSFKLQLSHTPDGNEAVALLQLYSSRNLLYDVLWLKTCVESTKSSCLTIMNVRLVRSRRANMMFEVQLENTAQENFRV